MNFDRHLYDTLVFDCDGVVLDSNKVKTQAFYQAALPYGQAAAQALVDYHVENGGVSRYKKFAYFLDSLVPQYAAGVVGSNLNALLASYARTVKQGLLSCKVAEGLTELRAATPDARWLIVSGGDQEELREVFTKRGLTPLFDGGIFGSPDTKDEILAYGKVNGYISGQSLFIGDSKYDHQAATNAGLDFVFISSWSEFSGWEKYVAENMISSFKDITEFLKSHDE